MLLIDAISKTTGKQIAMRGDTCVYLDSKLDVEQSVLDEAQVLVDEDKARELEQEAKQARTEAMLQGADYNGTTVSLTKDDGDGLVQVKSGFEMGLTSTVIHFENGTKLPMTAEEFPAFALWFVNERNKFFVGAINE